MAKLKTGLRHPIKIDFIKANTIANKAVSNMYKYPKLIKKDEMTPDMLLKRQDVIQDIVDLMTAKEKFQLHVSVSEEIYKLYKS